MRIVGLFLLITSVCFGQDMAEYGKLNLVKNYKSYKSKNGTILNSGDTLHIGIPAGDRFKFITQGQGNLPSWFASSTIVIKRFKVVNQGEGTGNILYATFKSYPSMVWINYELALEVGEIYNPHGPPSKFSAFKELEEQKRLLDLELITQSEYDKIKAELAPIILSDD